MTLNPLSTLLYEPLVRAALAEGECGVGRVVDRLGLPQPTVSHHTRVLVEAGLLRASFVPPKPIRALRNLTRYRKTQIQERQREANRLHKALEDAGIKLAGVDEHAASGRDTTDVLEGIVEIDVRGPDRGVGQPRDTGREPGPHRRRRGGHVRARPAPRLHQQAHPVPRPLRPALRCGLKD